jgi:hypothetical protein
MLISLSLGRSATRSRRVFSPPARSRLSTPKAAPTSVIALVQKLEGAVIAEKAAREKRLADVRERDERRREADRQKAAIEQATADDGDD